MKPSSILVYVEDIEAGLSWYEKAFPMCSRDYLEEFDFTLLKIGEFQIEIVQADSKVSSGAFGTVLYWSVGDLKEEMERFEKLGASLYRGPLRIENGLGMCQFKDPFGNLVGLRGPFT